MTSPLRRRTTWAAVATLGIGAILAATASATWAAPVTTASATGAGLAAAAATPSPGPTVVVQDGKVTVTLDAAQVQARCARVPDLLKRVGSLVGRIQGGADVPGSTAALRARADAARTAGRNDAAQRLDDRAALRADRVAHLQHVSDRLTKVEQNVCAPLAAQLGASS